MKLGKLFNEDDRGVSPVIGVILMVAITVILAAVIGTFVLGLGDQIGGSATAGVTIDGDNTTEVTVTLTNTGTAERVDIVDSSNGSVVGNLSTTGTSITISNTLSEDRRYNVVAVGPNEESSVVRSFIVEG
ncbi:type IV pilin [Halorubrum sp. SD690R]|uniref:archaellin/type IV pilin N-terminal domain-containing protein n=1 Tax=Halorubrum sp. SD690R TaxID=2518117 RepID=UPI0010F93CDE|nr:MULTISPECIES: type IV pilin N-terminal domain-containing protein [Halorubrum]MDB2247912.1 type IV pilin N-terminal domain-containing protein [Halorubrum ezzemoulense]TKX47371.1 type IV pilin [Halorubrum sp. SD690R]